MVLGDNIFHGNGFSSLLREAVRMAEEEQKATVFGYWVNDPERYGVAEFDVEGNCLSIEEKPEHAESLPKNFSPIIKACARPSGEGCSAYSNFTP